MRITIAGPSLPPYLPHTVQRWAEMRLNQSIKIPPALPHTPPQITMMMMIVISYRPPTRPRSRAVAQRHPLFYRLHLVDYDELNITPRTPCQ